MPAVPFITPPYGVRPFQIFKIDRFQSPLRRVSSSAIFSSPGLTASKCPAMYAGVTTDKQFQPSGNNS